MQLVYSDSALGHHSRERSYMSHTLISSHSLLFLWVLSSPLCVSLPSLKSWPSSFGSCWVKNRSFSTFIIFCPLCCPCLTSNLTPTSTQVSKPPSCGSDRCNDQGLSILNPSLLLLSLLRWYAQPCSKSAQAESGSTLGLCYHEHGIHSLKAVSSMPGGMLKG